MDFRQRSHCPSAAGVGGHTLLELTAAIAIAAALAASAAGGAHSLDASARLEAARLTTVLAALAGRRIAYESDRTVRFEARPGATSISTHRDDASITRFALPRGARVVAATAGGVVRFHAGGAADNATITLGVEPGGRRARVVINQRGLVR